MLKALGDAVILPCAAGEGDQRSWWRGRPDTPALPVAPSTACGGPPPPCFAQGRITERPAHLATRSIVWGEF